MTMPLPDYNEAYIPFEGYPPPRYAHLVEEDVHPFQALCGAEIVGKNEGPQPPICPKCLALYDEIEDGKEIVLP